MKKFYNKYIFSLLISSIFPFFLAKSIPAQDEDLSFYLEGKVTFNHKPVEGVTLNLMYEDVVLSQMVTEKNGKYKIRIPISDNKDEADYIVVISKPGMMTKKLAINSFLPRNSREHININDYNMEITMLETSHSEISMVNPSAKIKWNTQEMSFTLDLNYSKVAKKEEELFLKDPLQYAESLKNRQIEEQTEGDSMNVGTVISETPVPAQEITSAKKDSETMEINKLKISIESEINKMDRQLLENETRLNENKTVKNSHLSSLEEDITNELLLQKNQNDSVLLIKENAAENETLTLIQSVRITKMEDTVSKTSEENEKQIQLNKDIKYSGDNRFSRLMKAVSEQ